MTVNRMRFDYRLKSSKSMIALFRLAAIGVKTANGSFEPVLLIFCGTAVGGFKTLANTE